MTIDIEQELNRLEDHLYLCQVELKRIRKKALIEKLQAHELQKIADMDCSPATEISWAFHCDDCKAIVKTKDPDYPYPLCQDCTNAKANR